MRFSIITVTYNSRTFLAETIQSVLSQDFCDFEYIIIDGGSSDGTLDIIRSFADSDSRISWISEPDEGISDAFNKGIRMTGGDIIGILNSDDTYAAGALAAIGAVFETDSACDVAHGDMLRFQGDAPLFRLKPVPVDERVWHEMPVNHPATFVRRRAYDLVGMFDTRLKVAMDYDLVLRLYREGCRFRYLERVLANMRYGGASDERFLAARREVFSITVAAGYPRWRAGSWFVIKACLNITKNILKKMGLHSLIRLHPKFRKHQEES